MFESCFLYRQTTRVQKTRFVQLMICKYNRVFVSTTVKRLARVVQVAHFRRIFLSLLVMIINVSMGISNLQLFFVDMPETITPH